MSNFNKLLKKEDIRHYSDRELELLVYNTEFLYNIRHLTNFIDTLKHLYIFNDNQLKVLKQSLTDED